MEKEEKHLTVLQGYDVVYIAYSCAIAYDNVLGSGFRVKA
jgi:hypothetical protein